MNEDDIKIEKKFDIKQFIKRDFLYICVLLLALFAVVWTMGAADEYKDQCNAHWLEQFNKCGCVCGKNAPFTNEFNLDIPIKDMQERR